MGRTRLAENLAGLCDPEQSDLACALVELPVGAAGPRSAGQQPKLALADLRACPTPHAHGRSISFGCDNYTRHWYRTPGTKDLFPKQPS